MRTIKLKEIRERQKLSQEELAAKVGCHINTIRRWETGQREPRTSDLQKLCEVLGCTESELLNGQVQQEFEVKIIMGVKNLTGLAGAEVLDNTFFYGVQDDKPQIHLTGKVNIATLEDRKAAAAEMLKKFWAACWMYDNRNKAEENGLPDSPEGL